MILYHLTRHENIPSILQTGLLPREAHTVREHPSLGCCEQSVYLHSHLDVAENECQPGQAILAVNLDGADLECLDIDEGELVELHEVGRECIGDDEVASIVEPLTDLDPHDAPAAARTLHALSDDARAALRRYALESTMAVKLRTECIEPARIALVS
jgi:hypothetical protein